jgi:hypothetical protein
MLFTLKQARAICHEHRHLIGKEISKDWRILAKVEAIIVAPYDDQSQYKFLEEYKKTGSVEKSIRFYNGAWFDVLLVGKSIRSSYETVTCTLSKYLEEHDEPYRLENCLDSQMILS